VNIVVIILECSEADGPECALSWWSSDPTVTKFHSKMLCLLQDN